MPRWKQVYNEELGKSEFIPIDEAARRQDGVAIHGDIQSFVSPIDGSVISDRKQYREHCNKHGVVPSAEFSQEFLDKKREERERHYSGQPTKAERLERKQALYDAVIRAEREAGW